MNKLISAVLRRTSLQYLPVRVRRGPAKGAIWTLYPFTGYWRGQTEPETEAAIYSYVHEGMCCWDLGTHFGLYTVAMAMRVGPHGQVFGFEADRAAYERCCVHLRWNKLSWAKVFNCAVSSTAGSGNLIVEAGLGSPFTHLATEDEDVVRPSPNGRREVRVQTVRLDELVQTGEILLPDFIKVDVEGHGAKALKGALDALRRKRPTIQMAFHSKWEQDDTRSLLEPLGYKPFDLNNRQSSWKCEAAVLRWIST